MLLLSFLALIGLVNGQCRYTDVRKIICEVEDACPIGKSKCMHVTKRAGDYWNEHNFKLQEFDNFVYCYNKFQVMELAQNKELCMKMIEKVNKERKKLFGKQDKQFWLGPHLKMVHYGDLCERECKKIKGLSTTPYSKCGFQNYFWTMPFHLKNYDQRSIDCFRLATNSPICHQCVGDYPGHITRCTHDLVKNCGKNCDLEGVFAKAPHVQTVRSVDPWAPYDLENECGKYGYDGWGKIAFVDGWEDVCQGDLEFVEDYNTRYGEWAFKHFKGWFTFQCWKGTRPKAPEKTPKPTVAKTPKPTVAKVTPKPTVKVPTPPPTHFPTTSDCYPVRGKGNTIKKPKKLGRFKFKSIKDNACDCYDACIKKNSDSNLYDFKAPSTKTKRGKTKVKTGKCTCYQADEVSSVNGSKSDKKWTGGPLVKAWCTKLKGNTAECFKED